MMAQAALAHLGPKGCHSQSEAHTWGQGQALFPLLWSTGCHSGHISVTHLSGLTGGPRPQFAEGDGLQWEMGEGAAWSGGPQEMGHKLPLVQLLAKGGHPALLDHSRGQWRGPSVAWLVETS